ncbi:MAG: hypothetical protein BRC40_09050 [Cyanobacteria bacterium QH_8_48_120]|nr:MAG: hypothetical protein BRC34_16500 [Cyanobacteria bacterium QH_1_48_107]PSO58405.1 MAG: hypothetical protein BRC35_05730 [Cyanobacteria bacterium QH_10_48_56]PSO59824.1 MAG: hypothetical protein BRC36_15145 [Cyanobacteria bacterium QH_2_48_84]PSO62925.1 MAG: hypothetical protein BRC38_14775 [Cyanobacteria bacterium QH_6_48_35]PSO67700.1 MAG: hypothetical protein BRC39_01125 [Cyanobacteria bacterium QH_7_48_89]PSO72957.1 MAG: hypothetical protein BRC40_09050 [Cyanobacteria bacterium QH_8_
MNSERSEVDNSHFERQVQRLHKLTVYSRWLFVGFCWISIGSLGIWGMRSEFSLWLSHFTWVAVRYAIAYNLLSALCLAFCMGITAAVLIWQSRNILFGLSSQQRRRLEQKVRRLRATEPNHPLWKWVCRD